MLTEYVRDKQRLTIETAVRMLACETAEAVGLYDRGLVKPGYKADLNLIDLERLHPHAPRIARDLPENGRRLSSPALIND